MIWLNQKTLSIRKLSTDIRENHMPVFTIINRVSHKRFTWKMASCLPILQGPFTPWTLLRSIQPGPRDNVFWPLLFLRKSWNHTLGNGMWVQSGQSLPHLPIKIGKCPCFLFPHLSTDDQGPSQPQKRQVWKSKAAPSFGGWMTKSRRRFTPHQALTPTGLCCICWDQDFYDFRTGWWISQPPTLS